MRETFPHKKRGERLSAEHVNDLSTVCRRVAAGELSSNVDSFSGTVNGKMVQGKTIIEQLIIIEDNEDSTYRVGIRYYDHHNSKWKTISQHTYGKSYNSTPDYLLDVGSDPPATDSLTLGYILDATESGSTFTVGDKILGYWHKQRNAFVPLKGGTSQLMRWFRIISNSEVDAFDNLTNGETKNYFKCRDTYGCGEDDVPSTWGVWTDVDTEDCIRESQEDPDVPVLIYFPYETGFCSNPTIPEECQSTPWIGKLVQAFWNSHANRWETDTRTDEGKVDFVRFCGSRQSLHLCEGGGCPDENSADITRTQGIFDGICKRDIETCDEGNGDAYDCGGKNISFDVWIVCGNTELLDPNQECFPARRISDAFTMTYCPFGNPSDDNQFPVIKETRPVYSIGCCGCGCPDDELYLEFYLVCRQGDGTETFKDCERERVTVPIHNVPLNPEGGTCLCYGDDSRKYEGFFSRTYRVPKYVVLIPDPVAGEDLLAVEMNCISGEKVAVWQDHVVHSEPADGCGGNCYNSVADPGVVLGTHAFEFDNLEQSIQCHPPIDGEDECNQLYVSCRFCYRVIVCCDAGSVVSVCIQLCIPPGNPAYVGTVLEDPNAPLQGLIPLGEPIPLVPTELGCDGRKWYELRTLNFSGVADDLAAQAILEDNTKSYGFPYLNFHVFGGCCWNPTVSGAAGGDSYTCCYDAETEAVTILNCQNGAPNCTTAKFYVKVGWNCANDYRLQLD